MTTEDKKIEEKDKAEGLVTETSSSTATSDKSGHPVRSGMENLPLLPLRGVVISLTFCLRCRTGTFNSGPAESYENNNELILAGQKTSKIYIRNLRTYMMSERVLCTPILELPTKF